MVFIIFRRISIVNLNGLCKDILRYKKAHNGKLPYLFMSDLTENVLCSELHNVDDEKSSLIGDCDRYTNYELHYGVIELR